jgi:CRISPR-associated protein Cmr3
MTNKTYFVTLTPYQLFFFGGEQDPSPEYYLKGSFLPQQTALLGMIRYQVLRQNGLLGDDNKIEAENEIKAQGWIGVSSFKYDCDKQTFGKIISLSPCHIVEKTADDTLKYLPEKPEYLTELKVVQGNYFLPKHDPKEKYSSIRWKSIDGQEIFLEDFLEQNECNNNKNPYSQAF